MRITFFDYKKDNERLRAENERLMTQRHDLKKHVADLDLKWKITEEDIKHMIKIKTEKNELELEREKVKLQGEQAAAIAQVKDEYRDKVEANLKQETENIKTMYGQILERLPKVAVKLTGEAG